MLKSPSPSRASLVRNSLYKLNRTGDKQHPCRTPLPICTLLVSPRSSRNLTFCSMYNLLINIYIYIYIYAGSSVVRTGHGRAKPYWHTRECTGKLFGLKKFQPFFFSFLKSNSEKARWHIFSGFDLEFLISVSCYTRLQGDNANCRYAFHCCRFVFFSVNLLLIYALRI